MTDLAVLIFALLMPLDLDGRGGAGCGRDAGRQDGREEVEREAGICTVGGALRRLGAFGLDFWSERGATSQRTSFAQSSSVYVSLRSVL